MSSTKSLKICAGASAGGHMNELLRLLDITDTWPEQPVFYVTTLDLLSTTLSERGRTYVIGECNRYHPLQAAGTLFRSIKIVLKERPDVIITTGAMPLALFCLVARFIAHTRIVWIDSIPNIEHFSMSGRMIRIFADLFLTQWPELAENDTKAKFAGTLL